MRKHWRRHLIAGLIGVAVGYLLFASTWSAGAAPPAPDALQAFTVAINAIVQLVGQGITGVLQALVTFLSH